MNTKYIPPNKPQAASHMLWFFILPAAGFTLWASVKLIGGISRSQEPSLETRVMNLSKAHRPGDRWQAAYVLAEELQKLRVNGGFDKLTAEQRHLVFSELTKELESSHNDTRIKHYLLLTLGQLGRVESLPALEKFLNDKDSEIRFYAAWSFVSVLTLNKEALNPERMKTIASWLDDKDASLQKTAATFLVQQKDPHYTQLVRAQLKNEDREVKWNAAVALASVGDASAEKVLLDIFNLENLRALNIRSSKDLEQLVGAAFIAAKKLQSPSLLEQAAKLKASVNENTPEGRAIHAALKN